MDLEIFIPPKPKGTLYIRFSTKHSCTISREAVKEMDVKPGCVLVFFNDKENKDDWYVTVKPKDNVTPGFIVKQDNRKSHYLMFYNRSLSLIFQQKYKLTKNSFTVQIGQGLKHMNDMYYPLITEQLSK
jgi:hypothetical protein